MNRPICIPSHAHGMTLLEVLIAVVVLSIGLLGLAHLQLYGLEATDDSYRRSMATYIANDLADRMRANRTAARGGAYDAIGGVEDSTTGVIDMSGVSAPADPGCPSTGCTASEMADLDAREWLGNFINVSGATGWVAALDAGGARVVRNGDRVRIVVSWVNTEIAWDSGNAERTIESRTQTFDVEFDL